MSHPSDLESMLRSLRPGTLPEDMRQRLADPPAAMPSRIVFPRRPVLLASASLAAAACAVLLMRQPEPPVLPAAPLSVFHQESTLIGTRVIEIVEHNGMVWSLEEQHWKDEEIALCSDSPVSVRLSRDRHELVYEPVPFD
jgi:hypothetical protein